MIKTMKGREGSLENEKGTVRNTPRRKKEARGKEREPTS
jgi:hypothetical protein